MLRPFIFLALAALWCLMIAFPGQAQDSQTVRNLKEAYQAEMNASARYTAFAEQAKKEGFPQIALILTTNAKAEAIHAANHKTVLERMGSKPDPFKPDFTVKSTKENLQVVIDSETAEATKIYPGYIAAAKTEKATDAVKSMRWAMETEKRHIGMVQNAFYSLTANSTTSLPKVYFICPKCGNTYDTPKPESLCSFCSTSSSKFIRVDK